MSQHGAAVGRRLGLAAAALVAALLAVPGCASRPVPRHFLPAGADQSARALAAWRDAVARSETVGPSRLLYDAKIRQGLASVSGTLALVTAPALRGTLAGPFGAPIATYADGALTGEKFAPVRIEPEPLLALLAGVWREPSPQVRGIEGEDALLAWSSDSKAEGVLRMTGARFLSIRVEREGRAFEAQYSGNPDPWPARVAITDLSTGSAMRLVLRAQEPLP
jgi:hypothetical protein